MKQWISALVLLGTANAVSAAVIDFDDLPDYGTVPANYQGFTWSGWSYFDTIEPPFTPASGATRIYLSSNTGPNSISSATDFVFDGSYISGFDIEAIQYELYYNGTLVHASAIFNTLSDIPTFFASGYSGLVDEVVYKSTGAFFSVDNFTYSVSAVPEPESLSLMLAGLAVAGLSRRKQRKL